MKAIRRRLKNLTFKNRTIALFLITSLIPFLVLGFVSLFTIDSIIGHKVEGALESNLKQDLLMLENTLNNMNHVSQQLAFGNGANKLMDQLGSATEPFERLRLVNDIKNELNVISFTNPNIGLVMYYYPDTGAHDFENFVVRGTFDPKALPLVAEYPDISYFGPHKSFNGSIDQLVFSTLRKANLPDQNICIYIESGRNVVSALFGSKEKNNSRRLLLLDDTGRIAYSDLKDVFPENRPFPEFSAEKLSGTANRYHWNRAESNQGWSIVSVVPEQELNHERNQWLVLMSAVTLAVLVMALRFSWVMWKMVYRPLDRFGTEVKSLILSDAEERTELTNIPEFDYLLYQVRSMKGKIWDLYEEIERKEKRRADLEVEKLLYQINPHFLMNTLDTVHWLALMNGQKEIDKLVLSLNKLLYYNLGKMGETSTIGREIEALKEYLQLQQIRYDFQFDVDIDADEDSLALECPRFILQPLVENALYHGGSDDGYIYVGVKLQTGGLQVIIQDNGAGMSPETINRLLADSGSESHKVGMGIGMRYVQRILQAHYGEKASLGIRSELGKGTVISLWLPVTAPVAGEGQLG